MQIIVLDSSQLASPGESKSEANSQEPCTSLRGKKPKAEEIEAFKRELDSITKAVKDVAAAMRGRNIIAEGAQLLDFTNL